MSDAAGVLPAKGQLQRVDPHTIGAAITLGGAALAIVALWLPYWDAESLRRAWPGEPGLQDPSSLIERGTWPPFVVLAIACAVPVLIAHALRRTTWSGRASVVAGVIAIVAGVATILLAMLVGFIAGVATVFGGATQLESPDPGLGIYAEGAAGALMLIGGLKLVRPRDVMVTWCLIFVVVAILAVRLMYREAAFGGPYIGQSVSNAPG